MATLTFEKTLFLAHHGTKGQKWGLRRFQYEDGSLTPAGRKRYIKESGLSGDSKKMASYASKAKKHSDRRAENISRLTAATKKSNWNPTKNSSIAKYSAKLDWDTSRQAKYENKLVNTSKGLSKKQRKRANKVISKFGERTPVSYFNSPDYKKIQRTNAVKSVLSRVSPLAASMYYGDNIRAARNTVHKSHS